MGINIRNDIINNKVNGIKYEQNTKKFKLYKNIIWSSI
jgi:hypothetical protein